MNISVMFRCILVARKEKTVFLTGRSKNLDPTGFHLWSDTTKKVLDFLGETAGFRASAKGGPGGPGNPN